MFFIYFSQWNPQCKLQDLAWAQTIHSLGIYYIRNIMKYNLFTGLWGYGNIDNGWLPALQLTLNSSHQAWNVANIKDSSSTSGVVILEFKLSLSESDTDVFVYYCLIYAYIFYYWCSTREIKVGYKTTVLTQASDILGSPFRVIKVPERWMREEKECKARPSVK